jgi:hypothetical protein
VAVPSGTKLTAPGTKLSFGQNATVAHEEGKQGTVLGLKVLSAKQGALSDFRGFNLDDPYKRHGSYYYVRVAVTNRGKSTVGGTPVPLWGVSGKNTLLQAVQFTSSFKKCPTKRLPTTFAPGDHFHTCLVYLSPNKGSLVAVSYRPSQDYNPITWTGTVQKPATPKPKPSKKPGKKSSKKPSKKASKKSSKKKG